MNSQSLKRPLFNKNIIKILGVIIFCLVFIFPPKCLARIGDILPPGDLPSPWPGPGPDFGPEPTPFLPQLLRFLKILCLDFIVNAFVLGVGYLILKRKSLIKSWKFLKYVFFVTIGGALIDLIYVGGQYMRYNISILFDLSVLLTFLGLVFYNYWLSKRFFNLTKKQAIFIGLIMGIFTNPALASFIGLFIFY